MTKNQHFRFCFYFENWREHQLHNITTIFTVKKAKLFFSANHKFWNLMNISTAMSSYYSNFEVVAVTNVSTQTFVGVCVIKNGLSPVSQKQWNLPHWLRDVLSTVQPALNCRLSNVILAISVEHICYIRFKIQFRNLRNNFFNTFIRTFLIFSKHCPS